MTQTWHDLLFAHWPVDSQRLRHQVPAPFELDLFDGNAWIGIVPFHMSNVAPRWIPSLPWISEFPELNVRTYVRVADRPGIYFFSLDAGSSFAVKVARGLLNLPYYPAVMTVARHGNVIHYESCRKGAGRNAEFRGRYEPTGATFEAGPGSLEYFLTERYCLYHLDRRGRPYRLDIHHPPWALQSAQADVTCNTMADANGLGLPARAPLLHFVERQDMVAWPPAAL
jgi:uncharacterized protein